MKCGCGAPIISPAYINGKKVCQDCYFKKTKGRNRKNVAKYWAKWIQI